MYTSNPSGQFFSLQYESLMYLGAWYGEGRSISDRMSTETTTCVVAKPLVFKKVIIKYNPFLKNRVSSRIEPQTSPRGAIDLCQRQPDHGGDRNR